MGTNNSSERLTVSSGSILVIDQFMLANQQFLAGSAGGDPAARNDAARRYGGCLLNLPNGTYRVYRDAHLQLIALKPPGASEDEELETVFDAFGPDASPVDHVVVDTRCLVFVDAGILDNSSLLAEYRDLKQSGDHKAARDLLRENGAAVRYGFNQFGDELGVYVAEDSLVALWPH